MARVQKQQASCEKLSGVSIEASTVGGGAIPRREDAREGASRGAGEPPRKGTRRGVLPRSEDKKTGRCCNAAVVLEPRNGNVSKLLGDCFVQEGDEGLRMQEF